MVVSSIDDPERLRTRAKDIRVIALAMTEMAQAKASLLDTAEEYEHLAREAEERLRNQRVAA